MERDDFDRFLSDDEIVPSSGFVARVMDAVRVEAAATPAIPFPWSRALPGIVAVVDALVTVVVGFFAMGDPRAESVCPTSRDVPQPPSRRPGRVVACRLLLCTVPVVLSLRITRGQS